MPSDADAFEANLDSFKEFTDDEGRHFFFIKFDDDSGRVFIKQPSEDEISVAEFALQEMGAKDAMRKISSSTDFVYDDGANTQQNLRNLMGEVK